MVANGVLYSAYSSTYPAGTTYNAETGAILGSTPGGLPAIGSQNAYFLSGSGVQAVNLTTLQRAWSFAGDGYLQTLPIVVNDYVFVGSFYGNLYAVDPASGLAVWHVTLGATPPIPYSGGQFAAGLSAGDGLLLVPAGNTLTAFRLSTSP